MGQSLYAADFYAWTKEQAQAIRAGQASDNVLDRENVAEEIESLGVSERSSCESALELLFEHFLKLEFVGPAEHVRGWRKEVRAFRKNLEKKLSPSLSAELSAPEFLDELYVKARRDLARDLKDDGVEASLPERRPYDWRQLTDRDRDWYPEPRYGS